MIKEKISFSEEVSNTITFLNSLNKKYLPDVIVMANDEKEVLIKYNNNINKYELSL